MTASVRRQASLTSLSRYARAYTPADLNGSGPPLDFCNAFWGTGDGGSSALFARMRGAMRTMDELREFWKERAIIEEQYAARLAGLCQMALGQKEIGELRTSLDTLKRETGKQAQAHQILAQAIQDELEVSTATFIARQEKHQQGIQVQVEEVLKEKKTLEEYVTRARESYELDCLRVSAYATQSRLSREHGQGREAENVRLKMERAQKAVQVNQQNYAELSRALQDATGRWEQGWKGFCDSCQDLEEDRVEFMREHMWAYANAISTVCVSDDESCEKLCMALEQVDPEQDLGNFVRKYGTGSAIPDPPPFVDYSDQSAQSAPPQQQTTHVSNYPRISQRAREGPPPPQPVFQSRRASGVRGLELYHPRPQSYAQGAAPDLISQNVFGVDVNSLNGRDSAGFSDSQSSGIPAAASQSSRGQFITDRTHTTSSQVSSPISPGASPAAARRNSLQRPLVNSPPRADVGYQARPPPPSMPPSGSQWPPAEQPSDPNVGPSSSAPSRSNQVPGNVPQYDTPEQPAPYAPPAQTQPPQQHPLEQPRTEPSTSTHVEREPQTQAQNPPIQQQPDVHQEPAPVPDSESAERPPPTGQYTDDGRGVLFYVKALYSYQATIEEEFDFQEGDIIAVTATPDDGWWSGELLDEMRRQQGKHIFPSNFVALLDA